MQLFEYPYVIITIFAMCFIVMCIAGMYFAVKGLRTATEQPLSTFTTISALENDFQKLAKSPANRHLLYISISSDVLHDANAIPDVFSEIQQLVLHTFVQNGNSMSAVYEKTNFIVLTTDSLALVRERIQAFDKELDKCLLKYGVLNVVDAGMGLCFAVGTQLSFDVALRRAKEACVFSKAENSLCAEWNVGMGRALAIKRKIENTVEKELDNNRFFLVYQPILDVKTRKIVGAEVLSRLNSEDDGILSPGAFLPAVDAVGLNEKFDYYIFEKNCKWIANDKAKREKYIYTINFSRTTLCSPEFADKVLGIVEKYGLRHACLAVEILEDKNIEGEERRQMIANLMRLKENGMMALLDDFGNGFTTFSDLQNDALSIVKIDKSITQKTDDSTVFSILEGIIGTARTLGLKTLCEGVENAAQEQAAIRAGCDLLQGFYYHRPMPVDMLEKLFEENEKSV